MFLFGFAFFLVSVVLVVSMALTNVDKIVNSDCGASCGYVLTKPKKWNPIDTFLVIMSKVSIIFFSYFSNVSSSNYN